MLFEYSIVTLKLEHTQKKALLDKIGGRIPRDNDSRSTAGVDDLLPCFARRFAGD